MEIGNELDVAEEEDSYTYDEILGPIGAVHVVVCVVHTIFLRERGNGKDSVSAQFIKTVREAVVCSIEEVFQVTSRVGHLQTKKKWEK